MNRETLEVLFLLVLFVILGWWYFAQFRYFLQRSRSKRWPVVDAVLQKGSIGKISFGKRGSMPVAFVGYAYTVQGIRYAGFFALYGEEYKVRRLDESLAGATVQIRYDPSSPDVSFLVNEYDSRLEGTQATQNPDYLDQCPPFDLQNAIR